MKKEEICVKCLYKNEVEAEKVFERSFRIFADRNLAKQGELKRC